MSELNNSLTAIDWLAGLNGSGSSKCFSWLDGSDSDAQVLPDSSTSITTDQKPPYSYANLITYAITSNTTGKMTLSEIYQWISDKFSYYKTTHSGWKNSVRHNLSLNKCFKKVPRSKEDPGKGSYWAIDLTAGQNEGRKKKLPFSRINNVTFSQGKKEHTIYTGTGCLFQNQGSNDSLNLTGLNSPPSFPVLSPDSSSSSVVLKQAMEEVHTQSSFPQNTLEQVIHQSGILHVDPLQDGSRVSDTWSRQTKGNAQHVSQEDTIRRTSVDNITMEECDMEFLDNITTEQIQQYIDSCQPYVGSETSELQYHENNNNSSPVVDTLTDNYSKILGRTIDADSSSGIPYSFANLPNDPLLSAPYASTYSPQEEQFNTISTSGYDVSSPQSMQSNDDTLVSTSAKLVNKNGSGGTVTVIKKLSDSCSSMHESFSKIFSFPYLQNSADMTASCDDPFNKFESSSLQQSNNSSFELYNGINCQSDEEEIVDNFNWDSIL